MQLEPFYNPLALAMPRRAHSMMASSYDRRGGNHDWSNYVRLDRSAAVMMEADGPGCITRIWTADPQKGTIRIYLDRSATPAIEMPFDALFEMLPLSFGIGGENAENYARSAKHRLPMGRTSYCPIYFQSHCLVTIDPADDYLYYQINYDLYPAETAVERFDADISLSTVEVSEACSAWLKSDFPAAERWSLATSHNVSVQPDETVEIFRDDAPGIITGIRLELPAHFDARSSRHLRDNLWLTAHFDDDETRDPSVRAPIGPLFLDFGQSPLPHTLFVGSEGDGAYYLLFAMPYQHSAVLKLVNRSLFEITDIKVSLLQSETPPDPQMFRFRATYHAETPFGPDHRDYGGIACRLLNLDGRDNYEFLNVRAAGHFVGCGFHADLRDAPTDRACGEGDEMFFIDDDPRLTLYGTGAEDYVNDAWGVRGYDGKLSGDALKGTWGTDPQLIGYRLHISDAVPFVRKGRFTLEHGTGNNCSGSYRSVAYWYMDPASAHTRVEERRWEQIRDNVP